MATIQEHFVIERGADAVWAALRDVGAAHRLFPDVLTGTRMDGDARVVTFANGMVVRESIVSIDDATRRFAYAAVGGRARHHNASFQVFPDGDRRCRVTWITDLLPDTLVEPVAALMRQGAASMTRTLESA